MGVLANLVVKLSADSSALEKGLKGAQGHMNKLTGALKTGALAGGVAVAGLGVASVKMAMDFEKSFAEVKTLLPTLSDEAFGELQADLLNFSKEMGIATSEAVPALYQAISAGVPPENVISFMETASKAAIGGVTNLETAVDGITSVVNTYGADMIDAAKASDIMFTAVKLGKTDFEQLSSALFNVAPTAASLGISFEEVAASLAVMTAQGVPTKIATTQLRAAFVEASKGGTELDKAIKELSGGKGLGALVKEGKTGQSVLDDLRRSMPEQEFKDLFGSVEAMNAALALTGPNADKVDAAMAEMAASAGATDAAFGTIADTASFKLNKAMNMLKVSLMEIGLKVLPYITDALAVLVPWLEENLPIAMAKTEEFTKAAAKAMEPFVEAFVDGLEVIMPKVKEFVTFILDNKPVLIAAIAAIGVAIVVALGPASLAIAALVGIVMATGYVTENWDMLKAKADEVVAKISDMAVIGEIFDAIRAVMEERIQAIVDYITALITIGQEVISFFQNVFKGDWGAAWQDMKDIAGGVLDLVRAAFDLFTADIRGILEAMKPWEWIKLGWDTVQTKLWGAVNTAFRAVFDLPQVMVDYGKAIVEGLWEGIQAMSTWLVDNIKGFAGDVLGGIAGAFGIGSPAKALIPVGEAMVQGIGAGITNYKDWLLKGIGVISTDVIDYMGQVLSRDKIEPIGLDIVDYMHTGLVKGTKSEMPSTASSIASTVRQGLASFTSEARGWGESIAGYIMSGIFQGFQDGFASYARGIAAIIYDELKDALGASSPAKAMIPLGQMAAQGYSLGFQQALSSTIPSSGLLAALTTPTVAPVTGGYGGLGRLGRSGGGGPTIKIEVKTFLPSTREREELARYLKPVITGWFR